MNFKDPKFEEEQAVNFKERDPKVENEFKKEYFRNYKNISFKYS
jgi:hypothetical protein